MPSGLTSAPTASTSGALGAQAPSASDASTAPKAADPPSDGPGLTLDSLAALNTIETNQFERWYSQEHKEDSTVYYKG
ncbi:hypothetical protein BZA77DRAFT_359874 [Pyronema omphalodes]|nr:hypothetical protein BZA77DRAFT_359874 [Pyronema omphalodes]